MSIRYAKIKNQPKIFHKLFGVSVSEFEKILKIVEPQWEKNIIKKYKRPGRDYKLELADMLLMLLLYYRSYITQRFIGYLFGIDDSRVCRIIKSLEPILAKGISVSKTRSLKKEEIEEIIIDATEQQVERPQQNQKPYYSGKKKRHTIKTEIRVDRKGEIVAVSKSHPGSAHDFKIFKETEPLNNNTRAYVDSGYQGIEALHNNVDIPYKSSKNNPLGEGEKEYNTALSRVRVIVENIIGDIKVFRIMADRYRNKLKGYNIKFNIIAGIVNFKNGFTAI